MAQSSNTAGQEKGNTQPEQRAQNILDLPRDEAAKVLTLLLADSHNTRTQFDQMKQEVELVESELECARHKLSEAKDTLDTAQQELTAAKDGIETAQQELEDAAEAYDLAASRLNDLCELEVFTP